MRKPDLEKNKVKRNQSDGRGVGGREGEMRREMNCEFVVDLPKTKRGAKS